MKILPWIGENILFLCTLFLLAFIPLYPKLPLLDVKNTWVYIRAEDFVVVLVLLLWGVLLIRKKITLKTPLTLPIFLFWTVGAIATIHGVLIIFPNIANVFPNVAFLSLLRRIEYVSLFFIAYSSMKDKRFLPYVIGVLAVTVLLVVFYGLGQKYLGFPAYLSMNEEFAKGLPIRLSALSRVPSTFGGHYDLAAYLVLILPILVSTVFGIKNWFIKLFLLATASFGFLLLFMTVSRISFFVLLVSLFLVLLFQKRKFVFFAIPIVALVAILIISSMPALMERFGSTVKEVDVLVNAKTGEAIGHPKVVAREYFANKLILQDYALLKEEDVASPSGIVDYTKLAASLLLLKSTDASTGENLPQGTGYINLTLSPVVRRVGEYFYEYTDSSEATTSADVVVKHGDFLIKKAQAYDLSFTTRFQGEWPNAISAFKRNILFGSGYSSVSLAVDNSYLRMLAETGLLGFASFFAIFLMIGIYIRKALPFVESPITRNFVYGFAAGVVGLALNGLFIDVFEASKIAFLLWLLTGISLGALSLYQKAHMNLYESFKKSLTASFAIIIYLAIGAVVIFSPMISNFFVGDDFTWFRWAAEDYSTLGYFTQADGFFYRPATKAYFELMYTLFWLNPSIYHVVSIVLHFVTAVLVFLVTRKIVQDVTLSVLASFLFLILSGLSENVFWIAATGHLFNVCFILLSLLFFISWEEKKKQRYYIFSIVFFIVSLAFHELGIVTPLLIVLYTFARSPAFPFAMLKRIHYVVLFVPLLPYLLLRFVSQSHWLSGDYSYNLVKLPFNVVGNVVGYMSLTLFGPIALPFYQSTRVILRENILVATLATAILLYLLYIGYRFFKSRMESTERRIVIFGFVFFVIALLPFLGLGNIASRYSYLASLGIILLLVLILKKIYTTLLFNGKDIALAGAALVVCVFSLLHIMQTQQIHSDWYEAGEKTKRFIVSIDGQYDDYWAEEPMKFHFVDVPIRMGEAWVFPVGLRDAVWLVFQNPTIRVFQAQSVEQALDAVTYGSPYEKVFVFDETGRVTERKKTLTVQ